MITGMPRIAIAVHDFAAAVATFRDGLGMPVVDLSASSVGALGAKLAMCVPAGGSHIEIMSPAAPRAPLSQSLQRFLERRGEGLFALMLEAPDPDAEAEDLARRGLDVLPLMPGAGGRDVHPRSTCGVLIRVYPVNSFQAPPGFAREAEADSPALSGIERVILAVRDLDRAVDVYARGLALAVDEPVTDAARGVRAALCRPPSGGVIELVAVDDRSRPFARPIAACLDDGREGLFALVLQSSDLRASASALEARGVGAHPSTDSPRVLELERKSTFGALLRIEPSVSA